jgi:cysteine desulfurase
LLYFDHNSTTPVDPRVAAVLDRAHREVFGNASSIHRTGQTAKQMLEQSRRGIASAFGVNASEIIFTSGGTESPRRPRTFPPI